MRSDRNMNGYRCCFAYVAVALTVWRARSFEV